MTPQEQRKFLELSDERDQQERLREKAEREAFQAGRRLGHDEGRREYEAQETEAWRRILEPFAHDRPFFHELEERRWGPDGREHFGDPRPGDFAGRGGERQAEAG
jgi:hypothetical protein